jgi:MFS family permease
MSRDTHGAAAVVAAILVVGSAVNLQMPLFPDYAALSASGHGGRALLFATYILGLAPTLALAGGASDVLGRKPVVLAAMSCAALATLLMILSPTVPALLVARLLEGMAVALGLGSATAWLTERFGDPARASWWSSFATAVGFGGGGLLTSASIWWLGRDLVPWSYHLGLVALVLVALLLLRVPGGVPGGGGHWLRLPTFPEGTRLFTLANTVSWAVSGIVMAQAPAAFIAAGMPIGSGLGVFVLCATGAFIQLVPRLRPADPRVGMVLGALCSSAAIVLFIVGVTQARPLFLLAACAAAGAAGFGYMFLAGLTAVNAAGGERRAAAVSGFLLWSYLGFGGPCLLVAALADRIGEPWALTWAGALAMVAFGVLVLVARTRPVLSPAHG